MGVISKWSSSDIEQQQQKTQKKKKSFRWKAKMNSVNFK